MFFLGLIIGIGIGIIVMKLFVNWLIEYTAANPNIIEQSMNQKIKALDRITRNKIIEAVKKIERED